MYGSEQKEALLVMLIFAMCWLLNIYVWWLLRSASLLEAHCQSLLMVVRSASPLKAYCRHVCQSFALSFH